MPCSLADRVDRPEQIRHATAWDADVLHPDDPLPLEGAKREPSRLPQPVGLGRVGGAHRRRRTGRLAGRDRGVELGDRGRLGPVRLDEEHRLGVAIEPQIECIVDRGDGRPVEQLERHHVDACRDDARDRVAGAVEGREEGQHRRPRRRGDAETERRLGDDPERPLRPDEQVGQRVAGDVLDVLAAGPDDSPIGQDDLQPEHRVARLAVLDATQPAGVRAEVAADRADLVARGIRGVEQPLRGNALLELGVEDPGLGRRRRGSRGRSRGPCPSSSSRSSGRPRSRRRHRRGRCPRLAARSGSDARPRA